MVKNRSPYPAKKTNLIIAPVALLDQWKSEIEMKTNCGMRVLIYHGMNCFTYLVGLILTFYGRCQSTSKEVRPSRV